MHKLNSKKSSKTNFTLQIFFICNLNRRKPQTSKQQRSKYCYISYDRQTNEKQHSLQIHQLPMRILQDLYSVIFLSLFFFLTTFGKANSGTAPRSVLAINRHPNLGSSINEIKGRNETVAIMFPIA